MRSSVVLQDSMLKMTEQLDRVEKSVRGSSVFQGATPVARPKAQTPTVQKTPAQKPIELLQSVDIKRVLEGYVKEATENQARLVNTNETLYAENEQLHREIQEKQTAHGEQKQQLELMNNALELLGQQLKAQLGQLKTEKEARIGELRQQVKVLEKKLELVEQQMTESELLQYIMENGVQMKKYYDGECQKLREQLAK